MMGRKIRKLNCTPGRIHGIGIFGILSFLIFQMKKAEDEKRTPYIGDIPSPEYADPDYPSFWEQYFTRPELRDDDEIEVVNSPDSTKGFIFTNAPGDNFDYLAGWRAVARRHIVLNETMKAIVSEEAKRLGGKRTLGVHYRGTNKFRDEAGFISPQTYEKALREEAARGKYDQVFFCTDEIEADEYFREREPKYPFNIVFSDSFKQKRDFKNNYCDTPEVLEGKRDQGIWVDSKTISKFDRGKEALVDCLMLGECERIIRHRSNFPSFAIILSDKVKNQRFLTGNENYNWKIK